MKRVVYLVTVIALLLGCSGRREQMSALLDRADSLNRAYVPMTGGLDSLLLEAADYYDHHGTPNEQMRAHYLLGCAYRDMGEAPQALQCYQDAVDCADTLASDCDYRRLMSVYGQMAEIFHDQNLPSDEITVRDNYGRLALKIQDSLLYIRNEELLVKPYFLLGDTTSMIKTLLHSQRLYSDLGYEHEAAAVYPSLISIYIGQDSIEKAKELINVFETQSSLFDSEGNICRGREGYYKIKGSYYLKAHQLDSAAFYFRKSLLLNNIGVTAEAYKGLLAVYKEKDNVDSVKKYVQLFEEAVCKERDDIRTHAIHQMTSLYNYHRYLEKADAESKRALRIKSYLMLSVFLIAVVILVSVIAFLNLAHKKKLREKEAEALRRDYENVIVKKEQAVRELDMLKDNHDQLKKEKENEIVELNKQIREYAKRVLPAEKLVGNDPQLSLLIEDFHQKASRKKSTALPLKSDWVRLVHLFAKSQPVAYASIGRENVLSSQELKVCILLLLDFTNGEIISLLNISPQRMTNVRTNINEKLFKETNAHSLDKNLAKTPIV